MRVCNYHLCACGIYVRSLTRKLLIPLRVCWYARDWTISMLFYMKSRTKCRPSPACPEFAHLHRVFSTIQIVFFTSSSPTALPLSIGTNKFKIVILTHKVITHHQPVYLIELIIKHRLVYNLKSAENNLSSYHGQKQRLPQGLLESLHQTYGTAFHFNCDAQQPLPA